MIATLKKIMFVFVLVMVTASTGAWQGSSIALAAPGTPETPLAPGLTWKDLGQTVRNIQLDIQGDSLDLSGQTFQAAEEFSGGVPQAVKDFYSNVELFKSGWSSDNAFEASDGVHRIFYHESGYYLSVDYLKCADDAGSTCITVWLSAQKDTAKFNPGQPQPQPSDPGATATFSKKTPADGSTGINPASTFLSWNTYATAQKYSYCVKEGSDCAHNDPNWTGTMLNTSISLSDLNPNKLYHWQVKAIYNINVTPKLFVYADAGTFWKFTTTTTSLKIQGNAGVSGTTLSWVDGSSKTTTSDSSGNYTINVSYNWSGKVTPTRSSYTFIPASRTYTNVTTNLTGQNFIAINAYTISGNVGVAGAVLKYTDGTAKSVTSDANGNYSLPVTFNWNGTVTPTKVGYTFTPPNRTYTNVLSNQTNQNYVATLIHYTISGNAGVGGARLSYVDGTAKSVLANSAGVYSISVPYNWSGTVTPSKAEVVSFVPASRTYANVKANFPGQNYQANIKSLIYSQGVYDGYVRESTENSGVGGGLNSTAVDLLVGDDAQNRQYRSILSFNTSGLPETAVITSAKLKIRQRYIVGTNPITTHGFMVVSIQNPRFGASNGLELADFNAAPGLYWGGSLGKVPTGNLYNATLLPAAFPFINPLGLTQLRLAFTLDDNNDSGTDLISFFSGDTITTTSRPYLEIIYHLP